MIPLVNNPDVGQVPCTILHRRETNYAGGLIFIRWHRLWGISPHKKTEKECTSTKKKEKKREREKNRPKQAEEFTGGNLSNCIFPWRLRVVSVMRGLATEHFNLSRGEGMKDTRKRVLCADSYSHHSHCHCPLSRENYDREREGLPMTT